MTPDQYDQLDHDLWFKEFNQRKCGSCGKEFNVVDEAVLYGASFNNVCNECWRQPPESEPRKAD